MSKETARTEMSGEGMSRDKDVETRGRDDWMPRDVKRRGCPEKGVPREQMANERNMKRERERERKKKKSSANFSLKHHCCVVCVAFLCSTPSSFKRYVFSLAREICSCSCYLLRQVPISAGKITSSFLVGSLSISASMATSAKDQVSGQHVHTIAHMCSWSIPFITPRSQGV